jgi:hypothetical protein
MRVTKKYDIEIMALIRDLFDQMFPTMNDEMLMYEPDLAEQFDKEVRAKLAEKGLEHKMPRSYITGALTNSRKTLRRKFGVPSIPHNYRLELKQCGARCTESQLRDTIKTYYTKYCTASTTTEDVLRDYVESRKFAAIIRAQVSCPTIPDNLILALFGAMRKAKQLPTKKYFQKKTANTPLFDNPDQLPNDPDDKPQSYRGPYTD